MNKRKTVVPWYNWNEWQDVYMWLYSTNVYAQQRGVSRVASWRNRSQVPVAINATAQLIELQLHESMAQHHHHAIGVSSRSYMELCLLYSSIIVRCVNGLVDGSQKGVYAVAVSTLAQRIGIPLWIVDLRHESTHNQLPSLSVLRFAAHHLLAWLQVNYWKTQEKIIQDQVQHMSQWLMDRLPHLQNQWMKSDNMQVNITETDVTKLTDDVELRFDVDTLRNIVVPLLVDGKQFGKLVTPVGLLFLEVPILPKDYKLNDAEMVYYKEALVTLVLQLQPLWRSFSASLLARLCQKIFDAVNAQKSRWCSNESKELFVYDDEHAFEQSTDLELTLQWIKFMMSNEYRERVRLQMGPIEDLCQCGAEMLVLAENLKLDVVGKDRLKLLERLVAALKASKAVRNQSRLTSEMAIATSLESNSSIGWTRLPAWSESPMGLYYCYTSIHHQSQMLEFSLDDDSLMPDSATFVMPEDEEDEGTNKRDIDDVIDALMEDLDVAYDAALQQTLDLQAMIARNDLRQGGSTMVLPKKELQRIQEEIEIW